MASLIYSFIMLAIQTASAEQGPPPPTQNRPPELPIDDNIWMLLIVGVFFGIYIIYRRKLVTNKAS